MLQLPRPAHFGVLTSSVETLAPALHQAGPFSATMARKPPLSGKLARTIHTRGGSVLRTRAEARDYMTALPRATGALQGWQKAARDLLEWRGCRAADAAAIEYTFMLDGYRNSRPSRGETLRLRRQRNQ